VTSDWAGRYRAFAREFELAGKQMLKALIVHDQHDEVDAFDADLQSPASAADGDERGRAPAIRGAAGGYATAVLAADDALHRKKQKCSFLNSSGENHGLVWGSAIQKAPCSSSSAVTWNPAEDFFASNDATPSPLREPFSTGLSE